MKKKKITSQVIKYSIFLDLYVKELACLIILT